MSALLEVEFILLTKGALPYQTGVGRPLSYMISAISPTLSIKSDCTFLN